MKIFKFNGNYKDLEQVKPYFAQFKEEYDKLKKKGEYPYNYLFKGKIKGIEGNDEDRAIFLLQKLQEKEIKEKYRNEMLKEGWVELTENIVKEAIEKRKRIKLVARDQFTKVLASDWTTFERIFRPHCFNGQYDLMPLKAKIRGYSLQQFEDAFCKLV